MKTVVEPSRIKRGEPIRRTTRDEREEIPRRGHTPSHIDYVGEAVLDLHGRRERLRGCTIVEQAPFLRHCTARCEPLGPHDAGPAARR